MAPETENELLEGVALVRRGFVRKVVLGSAFAVPVIASFEMRSLSAFAADCISPNQSATGSDGKFSVQILDQNAHTNKSKLKIKVRDADTLRNVASKSRKVRLRKIDPKPAHGPKLPVEFDFKQSSDVGRFYQLKLDTSRWDNGVYTFFYTIGSDPNRFSVVMLIGGC